MSEESPESRSAADPADDEEPDDVETGTDRADPADDDSADGTEAETETVSEEAADAAEGDPDLAARVEEHDADLAAEVADLESRLADAESDLEAKRDRIEELEGALRRSKADFRNYKKRAKRREEEIRERATEDFIERIVSVRDNLVRALAQDEDADIRSGVESTVDEFDRILSEEGVSEIAPDPGSEVDPTRHEVLMRVDADRPEGTVAEVYRPGYEMAGSVLREARVTVSEGGDGGSGDGDGAAAEDDGDDAGDA